VIANDEFKFKEFNADSKHCRKTSLAPRFGSPLTFLLQIPKAKENSSPNYFAFASSSRVIGIGTFPLTGDPSKVSYFDYWCNKTIKYIYLKIMGIVAHPGMITGLAVSYDGQYLFSAGGEDLSVNMWNIRPQFEHIYESDHRGEDESKHNSSHENGVLPPPSSSDLIPFFSLLEGGEGGDLHIDLIDYFYYCQLRSLGENSMEKRNITGFDPKTLYLYCTVVN
jgi:WD40 repeat protein